ncbi:TetR-like C-terminal domain-containing protein, partial [Paenibacillus sp. MCAF20]
MMEKMADDMEEDIRNVLNQLPVDSNQSLSDFDMVNLVNLLEHIAANAKFYKTILSSKQTSIFTERLLKILTEMIASRIEQRASASNRIISASGAPKDIAIWYGSAALIGTIVQEQRASASNRIISASGAPKDIAIWYGSAALIGTIVQ